jgi:hypothetical protein
MRKGVKNKKNNCFNFMKDSFHKIGGLHLRFTVSVNQIERRIIIINIDIQLNM